MIYKNILKNMKSVNNESCIEIIRITRILYNLKCLTYEFKLLHLKHYLKVNKTFITHS